MRKLIIPIIAIMMATSCNSTGGDPEAEVASAVELFRKTMLAPDQAVFEGLTSNLLTYGHSNGLVEDRNTCIASMVTGKFKFLSVTITDQTIAISGNTAVVRHILTGDSHDEGKEPGKINLKVLQIWQKENGSWKLLARQAVKNS